MALDWSDLRHFLAVARHGSTLGAARELGVNQTTCARRIAALEEELGFTLFERGREGYRLSGRAAPLVVSAERVEREVKAFLADVAGAERRLSGTIRMTTNEPLANTVAARAVRDFRDAYPRVRVELTVGDHPLDIARGEADVALRVGSKPTDPCLVIRPLTHAAWATYCSHDYAAKFGAPAGVADLAGHALVTSEAAAADWVAAIAPDLEIACRSNSLPNLSAMLIAGSGIGGLPCIIGDVEPGLRRCFDLPEIRPPVFLVYHERMKAEPHVRAFLDFLGAHVLAKRNLLTGTG
ncbi:LysR family transcriptional regulator [Sphingomonas swuensis]|uniref:LysR family transcriptional regulator n=1 Tax=Sphingomonas swuensis TaxID=977800 RepID=A0ABP7SKP5_9SPHN